MDNRVNYLLDTNIVLSGLQEFINSKSNCGILIPSVVLSELDAQKSREGELGFRARQAVRYLFEIKKYGNLNDWVNLDNGVSFRVEHHFDTELHLPYDCNDDIIIGCLSLCNQKFGKTIMVSNDFLVCLKSEGFGFASETFYSNNHYTSCEYKGVKIIEVEKIDEKILAKHFTKKEDNVFNLFVNQYLIIKENGERVGDIEKWNGSSFVKINYNNFSVKPKDDLQACALDLLSDRSVPIKIITGGFGSGKTYLSCQQIFKDFKDNKYSKLVIARQAQGDEDSEDVGYLKGTFESSGKKIIREETGELEMTIPYYLKGRSFNGDVAVYVDECEDLSIKTLKLIGSRIGQNENGVSGSVIFSGDYAQTENKYRRDNGLLFLIEKTKDHPLVGYVNLEVDYRSEASKVFADL